VETKVLTPMTVFNLPQRLLVPLFQRKYVWNRENQWELLWEDIRRLTELYLDDPRHDAQHFLGAAVLQVQSGQLGALPEWTVIDGQQRLTTLQLIIDAAGAVMEREGLEKLSRQMHSLTSNPEEFWEGTEDRFKILPTNNDRPAFQEVMSAAPPIHYANLVHANSLVAKAHEFFHRSITEWLDEPNDAEATEQRATQLARVLQNGLQIVVINLGSGEDAQEIFETLNARGTPLTAADLIKNFVFRRLAAEGADIERTYREHWLSFETDFWEKTIYVGTQSSQRSSLFLNQWLSARLGEPVVLRSTFSRFRHFIEHEFRGTMLELIVTLQRQAELYRRWIDRAGDPRADLDAAEMFVYRTIDLEATRPSLLWLTDVTRPVPKSSSLQVIAAIESWAMRRALLGLTLEDTGRLIGEMITRNRTTDPERIGENVTAFLASQNGTRTYWPDDGQLRAGVRELHAYRQYRRGRLRVFLEAAEDHLRGYSSGGHAKAGFRIPRGQFHIEHLLPQRWQSTWPVEGLAAELDREEHVHRLGNLTLLSAALNSAVSNGPWLGKTGKLEQLDRHDVILMNRWVGQQGSTGWDEAKIDQRTDSLVDALIATWPVPQGHSVILVDPLASTVTVGVRQLVAAGMLAAGTALIARPGTWGEVRAMVTEDGRLEIGPDLFDTPSGAGKHVRGGSTDGWTFWRVDDGRRLFDLRAQLRQQLSAEEETTATATDGPADDDIWCQPS
jgi:hypothetical protein